MEWLYLRTAEEWAHRSAAADRWQGLALYGIDGTTLRVADSVENRDHFGGHDSGRHEGGRDERQSGYPLMRMVVSPCSRSVWTVRRRRARVCRLAVGHRA